METSTSTPSETSQTSQAYKNLLSSLVDILPKNGGNGGDDDLSQIAPAKKVKLEPASPSFIKPDSSPLLTQRVEANSSSDDDILYGANNDLKTLANKLFDTETINFSAIGEILKLSLDFIEVKINVREDVLLARAEAQENQKNNPASARPFHCTLCTYSSKNKEACDAHYKKCLDIFENGGVPMKYPEFIWITPPAVNSVQNLQLPVTMSTSVSVTQNSNSLSSIDFLNSILPDFDLPPIKQLSEKPKTAGAATKPDNKNIKPHKCTFPGCNLAFNRSSMLTRHMSVHSDEKPFACTFCDYRTKRKDSWKRHLKNCEEFWLAGKKRPKNSAANWIIPPPDVSSDSGLVLSGAVPPNGQLASSKETNGIAQSDDSKTNLPGLPELDFSNEGFQKVLDSVFENNRDDPDIIK